MPLTNLPELSLEHPKWKALHTIYSNFQTLKHINHQTFIFFIHSFLSISSNLQTFKLSNPQTFKPSNLQTSFNYFLIHSFHFFHSFHSFHSFHFLPFFPKPPNKPRQPQKCSHQQKPNHLHRPGLLRLVAPVPRKGSFSLPNQTMRPFL
jgi:hypothetical protein